MTLSFRVALPIVAALATVPLWGQEPIGPAFQLNAYTAGQQYEASVAAAPDGSYLVVWVSEGQDGDRNGVFGRRFAPGGAPLGPEFQVNQTTFGEQQFASVASGPNGNFVVVWTSFGGQDGDEAGIYGRRFNLAGAPLGSEFQVNTHTSGNQLAPRVAIDGSGNFVVVWQTFDPDTADYDLVGRRYYANGTPRSAEFMINTTTQDNQHEPVVCSDPTGRFVVAWTTTLQDGDFYGVWARRYSASGAAVSPEIHVTAESNPDGFQYDSSIACDESGGFLVVWQGDADDPDIFGRRYNASGVAEGPEFLINTYTTDLQLAPAVIRVPSGFWVFWQVQKQFNTTEGIFGQRLDNSGLLVGPEFQADTTASANHSSAAAAADADGNYMVAWNTYLWDGTEHSVFGRLYQQAYDFGDAPDPTYPTLRARDGARHLQPGLLEPSPLHLGAAVDPEMEPVPDPADSLDDDGVTFTSPLVVAATSSVTIDSSAPGLLDAWVDFSGDGDWNDAGEQVFEGQPLAAGANSLSFAISSSAKPGATAARFRVSSAGGLSPIGLGADGEVEDYSVQVEPVAVSVADAGVVEGTGGTRYARFLVSLATASPLTIRVDYATEDGTAAAPSDYASTTGTLAFPPGVTVRAVNVPIVGDSAIEADEHFFLNLSNPHNAGISDVGALGTIANDDHAGSFQFSAASYSVGESAARVRITVIRTGGSAAGVGVAYSTGDGSAVGGADYTPTSGVLTFEAGVISRAFDLVPLSDMASEAPETVLLQLHDPMGEGAGLGLPNTAAVTILDDDPPQTLRLKTAAYLVSEALPVATITVLRAQGTSGTVTVDYAVGNGTATQPEDYVGISGTLTFGPGVGARSFVVPIVNDGAVEGNETLNLVLSNAVGADLVMPAAATLTIVDNDVQQEVRFSSASYSANEAGRWATITVVRKGGTSGTVTVAYAAANGTAGQPADYGVASGTLHFGPGVATRTFRVPLVNDDETEGSETVALILSSPSGALLGEPASAVLTIVDSEPTFRFGVARYAASEAGLKATITVVRTGSAALPASVSYGTADGTATAGSDYVATSGLLTFEPGVTSRTFPLWITADTVDESDETIHLALSSPSGAGLGTPSTALVTVTDDDVAGTVRFSAASYSLSEAGGSALISVTRSGGASGEATIDYATSDGSGTAGEDYTASSGTLTFGFGEMSRTFSVPLGPDLNPESSESVNLTLSSPGGGLKLGNPSTAVLWIVEP